MGVVDVARLLDIPVAAVDLVVVAGAVQQVAGMVGFLSHVHNRCSSLLVLNFGHNRDNAWFALPSFFMILLALVYHNVIWGVFMKRLRPGQQRRQDEG